MTNLNQNQNIINLLIKLLDKNLIDKEESCVTDNYDKNPNTCAYVVGTQYFIRTVTYHMVGKLVYKKGNTLIFAQASWIADDGRLYDSLKNGIETTSSSEIEPIPNTEFMLNSTSIIDACEYNHTLPTIQK